MALASNFLLLVQKKVTKEKDTRTSVIKVMEGFLPSPDHPSMFINTAMKCNLGASFFAYFLVDTRK